MPHPHTPDLGTSAPPLHAPSHYHLLLDAVPDWLRNAPPARRQALARARTQVPPWHASATPDQHQQLQQLNNAHWSAQNQVDELLAQVQDINAFAEPLLIAALKAQHGLDLDVRRTFLQLYIPATAEPFPIPTGATRTWTVSLLAAALHNFEADEAEEDAFDAHSDYISEPDRLNQYDILPGIKQRLPIAAFVRLCRALDIGQRYQAYLERQLGVTDATLNATLRASVGRSQKAALKAALHLARMQNEISQDSFHALRRYLDGHPDVTLDGQPLCHHDLAIMSSRLTGIVLFGADFEQHDQVLKIVAYVPDDPAHPLREYESAAAFTEELVRQLREPDYQHFFSRFVAQQDRPPFFAGLQQRLSRVTWHRHVPGSPLPSWRAEPIERPNLQLSALAVREDLWLHLHHSKLDKILNDARVLAVPTATVDSQVRWALWDTFTKIASSVLNAASMLLAPFVPLLGEVMLAYMAYQLLDDTFESVVDWAEGQRQQAFEHFMEVVESIVQLGTLSVGGAVAADAFRDALPAPVQAFIDRLKTVTASDGKLRYWQPDLAPYETTLRPTPGARADSLGLHAAEGKQLLTLEGKTYAVTHDPLTGEHRITHPQRPHGYRPKLRHYAQGAWQTELDQPLEWDRGTVLRRMGLNAARLTASESEELLRFSGYHEDVLRKMHVEHEPAPPLLADMLTRLNIDKDIQALIEQLKSDDPALYHQADIQSQLHLMTNYGLWPESKALRVVDTDGNSLWTFNADRGLPVIQVSTEHFNNGHFLQAVLSALDDTQIKALFGENFGAPTLSLQARTRQLRKALAQTAENKRASIFEARYRGVEHSTDPRVQTLVAAAPGLPTAVAEELLHNASAAQLTELDQGRLPASWSEASRAALLQVRVSRAYEGLYLKSFENTDSHRLALHSLPNLPGWPADTSISVRDYSFDGALSDRIGPPQASVQKVLVRLDDGRYQAYDDRGQTLHAASEFHDAILQALPDEHRRALDLHIGQGERLRQSLRDHALDRENLGQLLEQQPIRKPAYDPDLMRLPGGMEGYGQLSVGYTALQMRAKQLFPSFGRQRIQAFLYALQSTSAGALASLDRLEQEFAELTATLAKWVVTPPQRHPITAELISDSERVLQQLTRRRFMAKVKASWRQNVQHEFLHDQQHLELRFSEDLIGELPQLPCDFSHLTVLALKGNNATLGAHGLLLRFPNLHRLELDSIALGTLPGALGHMPQLKELLLTHCQLQLTTATRGQLATLTGLEILDLFGNPLELSPDVSAMDNLQYLDLSRTHIRELPNGLLSRTRLISARLRNNNLQQLPPALFSNHLTFADELELGNNPYPEAVRQRIRAHFQATGHNFGVEAAMPDIQRVQALYPKFTQNDASRFFYRLPGDTQGARQALTALEAEFEKLGDDLQAWTVAVPGDHLVLGRALSATEVAQQQALRLEFSNQLKICWRRLSERDSEDTDLLVPGHMLSASLSIMGELPALTADFSHVTYLSLHSNGLLLEVDRFLALFPNLDNLYLHNLQLDVVPSAVSRLGNLVALDIVHCSLRLTPQTAGWLAELEQLEYLDLSHNRLGQTLDVSKMSALIELSLQNTGTTEIPKGLLTIEGLQKADLSNNNISEIPDDLFEIPAQISENFDLRRNPLSEQSLTRLKHYYRQTGVQLNVNLSNPMEINLGTEQFPNYGDPTAGVIVDPVVQPTEE